MPVAISSPAQLDARQRASVLELAAAVESADGAPPLSDQARTRLGSDDVRHFLAVTNDAGGQITGYAQLDGAAAEALGEPDALPALLDGLLAAAPDDLELWAHGTRSRLIAELDRLGFVRDRVLWQLRWPVTALVAPSVPAGVTFRPFVPGQDEAAWLAVNAAAFAHHPEQGGLTLADLVARENEAWFDPAGFLLAVSDQDGQLLGFHWTKQHSASLGEVYVLGVGPAAQGLKLGSALLIAGLEHLRSAGVRDVLLYVDESNEPAMALYEKYGFTRFDHDVQYRAPGPK